MRGGRNILKCLFVGVLLSVPPAVFGQLVQRSEVGGGVGVFNYTGDLVRFYNLRDSRPAATIFYRNNISTVVSMRASLTGGKLLASDRRPLDAFAGQRASTVNLFLLEASTGFEYHFLDWRESKRRLRFTPYLMAGIALFGINGVQNRNAEFSTVQIAVPLGGGMKYVLNPNWYVAFEFGARKTFFDYLDNISDGDPSFKNYQYGDRFDSDTYFFTGLTITRTFYDIPCPKSPY